MKKFTSYLLFLALAIFVIYIGYDAFSGNSRQAVTEKVKENMEKKKLYSIVSSVQGPPNNSGIRRILYSLDVNSSEFKNDMESLKNELKKREQRSSQYQMFYIFTGAAHLFLEKTVATTDDLIKHQREAKGKAKAVIHLSPTGDAFVE